MANEEARFMGYAEQVLTARGFNHDHFERIRSNGWTAVRIRENDDLFELAMRLGRPVQGFTGEFVRQLVPVDAADARHGTFGSIYGRGTYPLHSDTAFWTLPARYILLTAAGDIRRPTLLKPWSQVLDGFSIRNMEDLSRSLWYIRGERVFIAPLQFRADGSAGLRYDPLCMQPLNAASHRVRLMLDDRLELTQTYEFTWQSDVALIIDNWNCLHGRGAAPHDEQTRLLNRIYIR